jgi:hypothetical protein
MPPGCDRFAANEWDRYLETTGHTLDASSTKDYSPRPTTFRTSHLHDARRDRAATTVKLAKHLAVIQSGSWELAGDELSAKNYRMPKKA